MTASHSNDCVMMELELVLVRVQVLVWVLVLVLVWTRWMRRTWSAPCHLPAGARIQTCQARAAGQLQRLLR